MKIQYRSDAEGGHVLLGVLSGVVMAVVGLHVVEAVRYASAIPAHGSAVAHSMPLQPVTDATATVQSGQPGFRAAHYTVSPGRHSGSGIWACDGPSTFQWHFASDEVVYLLEGEVQVRYRGEQFTIQPGQTAVFHH